MSENKAVLEPSDHTHEVASTGAVKATDKGDGVKALEISEGHAVVSHGEHGPVGIYGKHAMKFNQVEMNPVLQKRTTVVD